MATVQRAETIPRDGHISSLPNELLIKVLGIEKDASESNRDYWRRLARIAAASKKLAAILQPALYDRVSLILGDNLRKDENPADDQVRHLRRCSPCLGDTKHLDIDGKILHLDNITSIYQRITIDHIARAVGYAPKCTHLQVLHAEILDPAGEQQSYRLEQAALSMPPQKDISEEEMEDRTHRSIGVGTRESEREKRKRERAEADEKEPKAGAPPHRIQSLRYLSLRRTYGTTPNATTAIIKLFPKVEEIVLDHIFWSVNEAAPPLPDMTEHRVTHLSCLDINFDTTSDIYRPYSPLAPNYPVFPILASYPGITKHVQSLTLGYTDNDWMNGADILSWTEIPLKQYEALRELTVCNIILRHERDLATQFFFRAVTSLLAKAPKDLRQVRIIIIADAYGGESGLQHVQPSHWIEIRNTLPSQLDHVTITLATSLVAPRPDSTHVATIRDVFNPERTNVSVTIDLTTKEEWLAKMQPRAAPGAA